VLAEVSVGVEPPPESVEQPGAKRAQAIKRVVTNLATAQFMLD